MRLIRAQPSATGTFRPRSEGGVSRAKDASRRSWPFRRRSSTLNESTRRSGIRPRTKGEYAAVYRRRFLFKLAYRFFCGRVEVDGDNDARYSTPCLRSTTIVDSRSIMRSVPVLSLHRLPSKYPACSHVTKTRFRRRPLKDGLTQHFRAFQRGREIHREPDGRHSNTPSRALSVSNTCSTREKRRIIISKIVTLLTLYGTGTT